MGMAGYQPSDHVFCPNAEPADILSLHAAFLISRNILADKLAGRDRGGRVDRDLTEGLLTAGQSIKSHLPISRKVVLFNTD